VTRMGLNPPHDGGIGALAAALYPRLRALRIVCNYRPEDSENGATGAALGAALERLTSLTELDINSNDIGLVGGCAVELALQRLTRMVALDVGGNGVDDALSVASVQPALDTRSTVDLASQAHLLDARRSLGPVYRLHPASGPEEEASGQAAE
jgi:Leucine Rich repeat